MFKIILGFLPWILYFILLGNTRQQHELAIAAALITTVVFDFRSLKKGFILSWGTLLFFCCFVNGNAISFCRLARAIC